MELIAKYLASFIALGLASVVILSLTLRFPSSASKALAFLFGLGIGGVGLFLLAFRFPHAWMPLFLGSFMAILVSYLRWTPKGAFNALYGASWLLGCFTLWLVSSTSRLSHLRAPPTLGLLVVTAVLVLASIVAAGQLERGGRRTATWLMATLMFGLAIAYLSGPPGRLDLLSQFEWLKSASLLVRKIGHFTLYGVLAWVSARASLSASNTKRDAVLFAFAVVLAAAGFDEIRQSTHPERVGSPVDILIDLAGAAVFLLFTKATKGVRSK